MRSALPSSLSRISRATVLSIDGVGAFDMISAGAIVDELHQVRGPLRVPLPALLDRRQRRHPRDPRGERGEQSDALMPMLCVLGPHGALLSLQDFLLPHEHLFAQCDDIYVVCLPDRVGPLSKHLQEALQQHGRIQVHSGRHRSGIAAVIFHLVARRCKKPRLRADPQARVWRGEGLLAQQGVRVLGIQLATRRVRPIGASGHRTLLNGFLWNGIFQESAWLLLLLRQHMRALPPRSPSRDRAVQQPLTMLHVAVFHAALGQSLVVPLRRRGGLSRCEWEDLPTAPPRALAALGPCVLAIPEEGSMTPPWSVSSASSSLPPLSAGHAPFAR